MNSCPVPPGKAAHPTLSKLLASPLAISLKHLSSSTNYSLIHPAGINAAFISIYYEPGPDINKGIRANMVPLFLALEVWRGRWVSNNNYN